MKHIKTHKSIESSILLLTAILILLISGSCRKDDVIQQELAEAEQAELETEEEAEAEAEEIDMSAYPDWTEETHSNDVEPNYSVVFKQMEVLRFDITISSANWTAMQADLASLFGSTSTPGDVPPGGPPPGGNLGKMYDATAADITENPMWAECSFKFEDKEWYHVGIRYKGNSSLQSTYQMGNNKFSFKLDFDEFEDDYPAINNQRFYGFKQLNLNNNYDDQSLMREKVGADLFRSFGLASAQASFCVVYIDYGNGSQYFGVYTLLEEVDDTVLETQFADGSGNLYKPDGTAATFASGTFNESEMEIKTNEDIADYTDVTALYNAINSTERTTNSGTWKTSLESVFNVDIFLKWLAANTTIQNWDTYGIMTHNYYLYNNPDDNLLTWIPWDNNEALQEGKQAGALSLELNEVGSSWPLIRYIIDQDDYQETYGSYLEQFITNVFYPSLMNTTYDSYYNLLKEYAYAEEVGYSFINSTADFDNAVEDLKTHVEQRNSAVNSYLQ